MRLIVMWEEGIHIYGTPRIPNNYPLTSIPNLNILNIYEPNLSYHKSSVINIKFYLWFRLFTAKKKCSIYIYIYKKQKESLGWAR